MKILFVGLCYWLLEFQGVVYEVLCAHALGLSPLVTGKINLMIEMSVDNSAGFGLILHPQITFVISYKFR